MSTATFDRKIIIKDEKTAKILCDVLNDPKESDLMKRAKKFNSKKAMERGRKLLKQFSTHLKNLQ